MAKRFVNAPQSVVPELMQGLGLDSTRVTLLDPASGHHVAVRTALVANSQTPRVSVVSGGGSGHEPMSAGYVGDGMLAAAVAGGVFASPSTAAVSAMLDVVAPRSVAVLMLVMNYQGDRLNFDKAAADLQRKSPGYPIRSLHVSDDVALPGVKERRGIAGSVFVLKVAGAAADQGRPFQEVVNIAQMAIRSTASYGIALEPCTIPGHVVDAERLAADEVELGMGIHGEPGAEKQLLSQMRRHSITTDLTNLICKRLDHAMRADKELSSRCTGLAIMVNNLGAVSQAEMLIVAKAVADFVFSGDGVVLNGRRHNVHLYVGTYMTSLQMNGVSVSSFMLPDDQGFMHQFLHAPTECAAWGKGFPVFPPQRRLVAVPNVPAHSHPAANVYMSSVVANAATNNNTTVPAPAPPPQPQPPLQPQPQPQPQPPSIARMHISAPTTRSGLGAATEMNILQVTSDLQSHCDELTLLDRRTGDGDLGDTIRRGCAQIRADLEQGRYHAAAHNPSTLLRLLSQSTETMGGSSGVLTSVFLEAGADSLVHQSNASPPIPLATLWKHAFVAGTHAVMEQGGAQVGDRTVVDALKPAAVVLERDGSLEEAAHAARVGFESTKLMTSAKFGRSAHVRPDKLLNQPDPGALAVCIILDALVTAPAPAQALPPH